MKHVIKIFMEDCVLVEDKVYFFSKGWNALYALSPKSKEIKLISIMPEEKIFATRLCAGIMHHKDKLILIPMTAKKIWIYDLKTDQWIGLKRKKMGTENTHQEIFRAIEYKEFLFLIGSNYPSIIRLNMNSYELEYWSEPYDFLMSFKNEKEAYFRSDFLLENNQLFLASCLNNYVLCLNLETLEYNWHEVGERKFRYSGIARAGEYYWLSPRTGTPIVKWDGKNQTEYFPLPVGFDNKKYNFLGVQHYDGKIIFPGMLQNKSIRMNSCYPYKIEICDGQYYFYKCFEKKGVVFQRNDGMFSIKYPSSDEIYTTYCMLPQEQVIEFIRDNIKDEESFFNGLQIELLPSSLVMYLLLVESKKEEWRKKIEIGVDIWKSIRN